MPNNTL